jgi:hypothetical protein
MRSAWRRRRKRRRRRRRRREGGRDPGRLRLSQGAWDAEPPPRGVLSQRIG